MQLSETTRQRLLPNARAIFYRFPIPLIFSFFSWPGCSGRQSRRVRTPIIKKGQDTHNWLFKNDGGPVFLAVLVMGLLVNDV